MDTRIELVDLLHVAGRGTTSSGGATVLLLCLLGAQPLRPLPAGSPCTASVVMFGCCLVVLYHSKNVVHHFFSATAIVCEHI